MYPRRPTKAPEPATIEHPTEEERERMFGYNFCPVKYVRAAGDTIKSLHRKLTDN